MYMCYWQYKHVSAQDFHGTMLIHGQFTRPFWPLGYQTWIITGVSVSNKVVFMVREPLLLCRVASLMVLARSSVLYFVLLRSSDHTFHD